MSFNCSCFVLLLRTRINNSHPTLVLWLYSATAAAAAADTVVVVVVVAMTEEADTTIGKFIVLVLMADSVNGICYVSMPDLFHLFVFQWIRRRRRRVRKTIV